MTRLVGLVGLGFLALAARAQSKATLKVGDMAPDFALPSTAGKEIRLSDFRGNRVVILAFFPAAFTGGCTKEMKGYQANLEKVAGVGAQVLGISTDNLPSLQRWAQELNLEFPLLSDFSRKVSAAYGVLNETRGTASRTTFVIDKEGRIQHIIQGSEAIDPSGAIAACSRLGQGK
jgi:peroxiredoxin